MKLSALVVILIASVLLLPPRVSAHVLEADGSIGAVLHVTPEDDPIAGEKSQFFFEFKDKDNKFTPAQCDCTFIVEEDGKEIFRSPLFVETTNPSLTNASLTFTFPQKNIYVIKTIGKPKTDWAFQPFTLSYSMRVAKQTTTASPTTQNSTAIPPYLFGIIAFVIVVILGATFLWKSNQKKKKGK